MYTIIVSKQKGGVLNMNIKPLYDNVLLEKEKTEDKTASGIILSTKEKEQAYANVVAVGEGTYQDGKLVPLPVKPGDKVLYKKYSTTDVKIEKEEYLLISAKDILAIVNE